MAHLLSGYFAALLGLDAEGLEKVLELGDRLGLDLLLEERQRAPHRLGEAILLHYRQVVVLQVLEQLERRIVVLGLYLLLELPIDVEDGQVLVERLDRQQYVVLLVRLLDQLVHFDDQIAAQVLNLLVVLDQFFLFCLVALHLFF